MIARCAVYAAVPLLTAFARVLPVSALFFQVKEARLPVPDRTQSEHDPLLHFLPLHASLVKR